VRVVAEALDVRCDVDTWLCLTCGLAYNHPQPDAAVLERFYASQFRDLFVATSGEGARMPAEGSRLDQVRWLERVVGDLRGRRVLEIGCYDGLLLRLLAERGAHVLGVEPSEAASRHARERGLDVRTATLEAADLPRASFDLVVASHVLEHLRDPHAALSRCRELVTPSGALFVEVPNVLRPRVENVVNFFTFDHLFHFSPRTLRGLARACGFEQLCVDDDFPFPAFRWLGRAAPAAEHPAAFLRLPPAVEECRRAAQGYVTRRERFIANLRARLAGPLAEWSARNARVAVYGAGFHTEYLLKETSLGTARIVGLVDGNPAKQGLRLWGHAVHAPERLPELAPDAIVISSYDFQEEMVARVRALLADATPPLLTFYDRPTAFSTFARAGAAAAS
jgi:SAM-dependent methyltransferase